MAAWILGHLGIWAFGHLATWVFGYLGIWVFGHLVIRHCGIGHIAFPSPGQFIPRSLPRSRPVISSAKTPAAGVALSIEAVEHLQITMIRLRMFAVICWRLRWPARSKPVACQEPGLAALPLTATTSPATTASLGAVRNPRDRFGSKGDTLREQAIYVNRRGWHGFQYGHGLLA